MNHRSRDTGSDRHLPTGTVTFLFTDIEGSTQLLQQLGPGYADLLTTHHRLLREIFTRYHGQEVDTQGDAFFISFPAARDAVRAAVDAQRAFAAHTWPDNVSLRVRMGLHTGEPLQALEGYVGMDVHRAARIAHIGHGRQVLLSETTTALVIDDLPEGVNLADLGRHLLKDLHRPEHIHQLVIASLPSRFPPLTSLQILPSPHHRPPRTVGPCPYLGLAAFGEEDAQFFFGREAFTKRLHEAVLSQPMVAVIVGSSGSGKSSVVFAGLLPQLRGENSWILIHVRPGSQPFHTLASKLVPLLEPDLSTTARLVEARHLADALAQGEIPLQDVLQQALTHSSGAQRLLLVIDQFEELYTLCTDADAQMAFTASLLEVVEAMRPHRLPPLVILLTLRADFMGQALAYRPFADALQEASLLMGPMTRSELRMAIEKPAEMQGAAFEPGLVPRILDDVGEKPGNLPLLEFTLTLLWEQQTDGWLTHDHYEAMGEVEGALATYADQVFMELSAEEQSRAPRALVQLVRPGEGTEDTRRVATRSELGEENWLLLQHLADRRLVVTGLDAEDRETAEVVHEALIQRWARFRKWIDADRAFRTWQERLRGNLQQWQESNQDEGALLSGAPLLTAINWLAERASALSPVEIAYIEASQALQTEREQSRVQRRRRAFMGLATGLVITLILAAVALVQRQNSLRQAAILLAGQAETELANGYHDRAVLLALSALKDFPYTAQAEHALGQAVSYSRALLVSTPHASAVTSLDWSPDGTLVASSSSTENQVHIWDPLTGETLQVIDMPTGITGNQLDMALNVRWSPDGKRLLTINGDRYSLGSQDFDVLMWDAESGKLLSSVEIENDTAPESGELEVTFVNYMTSAAAAICPESERLATLGGDNTALIWNEDWQQPVLGLNGHTGSVNSVAWSPDETRLVTASLDGTARVWGTETGQSLLTLEGHEGAVTLALWSPDGSSIITAGKDGTIRLWDGESGESIRRIDTGAGAVTALAWAPNGVRFVSGHEDGSLRIWEVDTGVLLETLRGHQGMVSDLKWSPIDDRLASADHSGTVRIWNSAPSTAWRMYPPQAEQGGDWATANDWFSDGRYLLVSGGDMVNFTRPPVLEIWDVEKNELLMTDMVDELNLYGGFVSLSPDDTRFLYTGNAGFPDFSDMVTAYVFDTQSGKIIKSFTPDGETIVGFKAWSPDGMQVATSMWSKEIVIWDYQSGEEITRLVLSDPENISSNYVEWSPDGSKIASAHEVTAQIWDAHTWEPLLTLRHESPTGVLTAAWSPDGKRLLTTAGNDERGAEDTTARIWDASTGEELLVFSGHTEQVWPGGWSPNGQRVVTASNDDTVRIWNAKTAEELLTLHIPVGYGIQAEWSPDGQHVAIGANMSLITVWRVWQTTDELLEYAQECCAIRQLTSAELIQFGLR